MEAEELSARAEEKLAAAGALLAARRQRWSAHRLVAELATVDTLASAIRDLDRHVAELDDRARGRLARVLNGRSHRAERAGLRAERASMERRLRTILVRIAERAPAETLPEADRQRADAAALRARCAELSTRPPEAAGPRRSVQRDGRQGGGPPPVESPLRLSPGEIAVVCVPATMTREGTSLRHPGTLVLTTLRLAFLEGAMSVEIPLTWIALARATTGGLVVYQRQRKTADGFAVASPAHVLGCLDWLLGRQSEEFGRGGVLRQPGAFPLTHIR